ncbi:DUF2889 domain-containing protein [Sphingobium sp. BYY-5]|uniref:DUF2889 domain-containing protein n=1 Tax=Sphingobium sp. BYY-5 TaxID=2926400 RepID=UPI001FA7AD74|nr:DUF2889 domain-containing protein [Sphingobium sp. BYY-5]MCI4592045.1 DUF2889 domain-containing protein [Sphingobium sp. BYY-5]
MDSAMLDVLPGFRRRFLVTPTAGQVTAAVEDDYHSMAVTLHHDGAVVSAVDSVMERVPWTSCPGAPAVLQATFTGVAPGDIAGRGEKKANCTHLHDLVLLAAAHAGDIAPTRYEILACDPVDGLAVAEIRRDGIPILQIAHRGHVMTEPVEIADFSLMKLRGWIDALDEPQREAARLLQWGTILANGRLIPMERQSTASRVPPNCFTFQPENAVNALRVGRVIDFSAAQMEPLDHFDGATYQPRPSEG